MLTSLRTISSGLYTSKILILTSKASCPCWASLCTDIARTMTSLRFLLLWESNIGILSGWHSLMSPETWVEPFTLAINGKNAGSLSTRNSSRPSRHPSETTATPSHLAFILSKIPSQVSYIWRWWSTASPFSSFNLKEHYQHWLWILTRSSTHSSPLVRNFWRPSKPVYPDWRSSLSLTIQRVRKSTGSPNSFSRPRKL